MNSCFIFKHKALGAWPKKTMLGTPFYGVVLTSHLCYLSLYFQVEYGVLAGGRWWPLVIYAGPTRLPYPLSGDYTRGPTRLPYPLSGDYTRGPTRLPYPLSGDYTRGPTRCPYPLSGDYTRGPTRCPYPLSDDYKRRVLHTTWNAEDMIKCWGSKRKKRMVHNAGALQVS